MRKLVIATLTMGTLLVMGALEAADLRASRREVLDLAESRADNMALILSEYLVEVFEAGDAALRQLAIHSARVGGPQAPARDWIPSLASARAGLTGIGAISVVDRDLIIRHSSRSEIVGQSRADDRSFAEALRAPGDDLVIGQPFFTDTPPGGFVLPLGRRLAALDGTPSGAVVASFIPGELRRFFQSIDVGQRGMVWVFHPDGIVLFREPSAADPLGEPADRHPLFEAARSRSQGLLRAAIEPQGPLMLSAFRTAKMPALIAGVSLDADEVLIAWRREALGSAAIFVVVALLLGVTLLVLNRQIDQRASAERALTRSRQLEAARLREANERLAATVERERIARQEAEEASSLKDQFLMTLSHELRTPLTAIAGWASMLVDGLVDEERKGAALRSVDRNTRALTRLIDDLLDVSAIETGKLRLDVRPLDLTQLVRNAVEAVTPAVDAKGIRLTTRVAPEASSLAADPERLQQIVWNLLSNAVKFTPSGGAVTLSAVREGDEILVAVADTGAGISPEFLPHVFGRFRQERGSQRRPAGGLGLGLAIVRSLAELHGGSAAAFSEGEGRGATFTVRLPAPAHSGFGQKRRAQG